MANGKGRSAIYRYAKQLASRFPLIRHIAPPLDRALARLTGGRRTLTGLLTGLPVVHLTTTGARSGLARRAILVGIRDGHNVALIASNWGQKKHPAWLYNLRANPTVMLALAGQPARPYTAREVADPERARLWRKAAAVYPGYEQYAHKAAPRKIPVILLSPVENLR